MRLSNLSTFEAFRIKGLQKALHKNQDVCERVGICKQEGSVSDLPLSGAHCAQLHVLGSHFVSLWCTDTSHSKGVKMRKKKSYCRNKGAMQCGL